MTPMAFFRLVFTVIIIWMQHFVSPNSSDDKTQCGVSNFPIPRVIGGIESNVNQWPWLAAIFISFAKFGPEIIKHIVGCGGVVISSRHVLTAAHCAKLEDMSQSLGPITPLGVKVKPVQEILVRLGDHNIGTTKDPVKAVDFAVSEVHIHESYEIKDHVNDIAILKLAKRIEFDKGIQPICIPSLEMSTHTFAKYRPIVAGWGTAKEDEVGTNFVLRHVQLDIATNEFCQTVLHGHTIRKTQLCAGYILGGKDACQGDSGGPLILPINNHWHVIGVTSVGYKCAVPGQLAIYTRVTEYIPWIHRIMALKDEGDDGFVKKIK